MVAGHKGQPEEIKKGGPGGCGARVDAGPWRKEKLSVLGMLQRGEELVIRLLENVQQTTIGPFIRAKICPGTQIHTDE